MYLHFTLRYVVVRNVKVTETIKLKKSKCKFINFAVSVTLDVANKQLSPADAVNKGKHSRLLVF